MTTPVTPISQVPSLVAPKVVPGRAYEPLLRKSSLLFHWRAEGCSLRPVTGESPTFSRASAGGAVVGANGALRIPVHSQPRWAMADLDGDGVRETPGLVIEGQRTNLITYSEALDSWSKTGTPVVTENALLLGAVGLALVSDDDGAALERVNISPAFTANAVKALRLLVKAGSSQYSTIQLYDNTAAAARLQVVITWTAGVPSYNTSVGTLIASNLLADGVYELIVQTTSLTAANSHTLYLTPAGGSGGFDVAATGTTYFGAVQAEDAPFPSSYVKTTGATATRSADRLLYSGGFLSALNADTDDLTVYAAIHRPTWRALAGDIGSNPRVLALSTTNPRLSVAFLSSSRALFVLMTDAGGTNLSVGPALVGDPALIEVVAQFKDLTVLPAIATDVGAGMSSFTTGATAGFTAFGDALVEVGSLAATSSLFGAVVAAKVARGLRTLQQMREAL